MKGEPIPLYRISTQADQLPNKIGMSIHAVLSARQTFLTGTDALAYAKTLKDTNACRAVRLEAIARAEVIAHNAVQAALQATLQAALQATELCRWIGREDLACAHRAQTHAAEAIDSQDPQVWTALAPVLVAAAALARGFSPCEYLADALLRKREHIWPALVDGILAAPKGPAPRACEGAEAAFLADLRQLAKRLRSGNHRYGNSVWYLSVFGAYDEKLPDQWCAYGDSGTLWRGHEVSVSLAEIDVAGYAELATVLHQAGEKQNSSDNFLPGCDIGLGWRVVMGSLDKPADTPLLKRWRTQMVMPAVAAFIERLVGIIECRSS